MPDWKRVKITFPTLKLGQFIEPVKRTVAETNGSDYHTVYGVTNTEGITITGKKASKDVSSYIVIDEGCFAYNPYRINVGSIGFNDKGIKGCVSPAYVVFKIHTSLSPMFLFLYLKSDFGNHLINWYGNRGGVRNALRYYDLCEIDIPKVDFKEQSILLDKIQRTKTIVTEFDSGVDAQLMMFQRLRQAVLQEAVEGKLTAEWRKQNSKLISGENHTFKLLEKIRIEKDRLIKNSKMCKEKPLLTIAEDEKPFALPEGWTWVRFAEICEIATNNVSPFDYPNYIHLAPDNIEKCTGRLLKCTTVKEDNVISVNHLFHPGMLVYSKVRPRLRKIVKVDFEGLCSADMYPLVPQCNPDYLKYIMLSNYFDTEVYRFDNRVKMPKINQDQLNSILIPLAPLEEQASIVARVSDLMHMVDTLEKQVAERKEQARMLMRSVLREAFETS